MVRIHHITDLHVGPLHHAVSHRIPFVPNKEEGFRHLVYYRNFLSRLPQTELPDLIIISGDLTSYATEHEFDRAKECIKDFDKILRQDKHHPLNSKKRLCIVQGNHDLDWEQKTYDDKIRRFTNTCEAISGIAYSSTADPCIDFPELNITIALLDSCTIGGAYDPNIEELRKTFKTLKAGVQGDESAKRYNEALEKLQDISRHDAGFIPSESIDNLEKVLNGIGDHEQRLKIAVMHHNPSNLPAGDIELYDRIINGGEVKQRLLALGFDMILHGHRHFQHCSYEEYMDQFRFADEAALGSSYRQGLYIISGGTMGSDQRGAWFDIRLEDTTSAHLPVPPSSLVNIHEAIANQGAKSYRLTSKPKYRFLVDKPTYANLRILQEHLGRTISGPEDYRYTESALKMLWRPLFKLQANIGDWSNEQGTDWNLNFNKHLKHYTYIYATDALPATSILNASYLSYLAAQFYERYRRKPQVLTGRLHFSRMVLDAIQATQWTPLGGFAEGYPKLREEKSNDLEIVRILHWDCDNQIDVEIAQMVDMFHRIFGIPLFILPRSALEKEHIGEEFVLGLDAKGDIEAHSFYENGEPTAGQVGLDKQNELLHRFEAFLQNERLKCVEVSPLLKGQ